MTTQTAKIKGYKQIDLRVYKFCKSYRGYWYIGTNKENLPLQEYVNNVTTGVNDIVRQIKEKLK